MRTYSTKIRYRTRAMVVTMKPIALGKMAWAGHAPSIVPLNLGLRISCLQDTNP